jgi:hypothetical protein
MKKHVIAYREPGTNNTCFHIATKFGNLGMVKSIIK